MKFSIYLNRRVFVMGVLSLCVDFVWHRWRRGGGGGGGGVVFFFFFFFFLLFFSLLLKPSPDTYVFSPTRLFEKPSLFVTCSVMQRNVDNKP